jgi:hypothetical protein
VQWQAASHVPMARPQPDQPWHKPTLFPPSAQRRKQNSYQSKKSFAVLEESCPGERERGGGRDGGASFLQFLSHCHIIAFTVQKISWNPSGSAHRIFPVLGVAWSGVEWRGVATTTERRTPIPLPRETEGEEKSQQRNEKSIGDRVLFRALGRKIPSTERARTGKQAAPVSAFVPIVLGCAFALWSPLARKESLVGLFPVRSASLPSVE